MESLNPSVVQSDFVRSTSNHQNANEMGTLDLSVALSAGEQSTSNHRNAAACHGGAVNSRPSSSAPGGELEVAESEVRDGEKIKLIQMQLVLLIHAYICRKNVNQSDGEVHQCSVPLCSTLKLVLNHITICQAGKSCTVNHCSSSREILAHWRNCRLGMCRMCSPLKVNARQYFERKRILFRRAHG
ncbi:e1A binding protein p300 a [Nephila pilipes]|uniref:histone acetyltransferase n=1 Tax=Nephila pilipes TaxID=299642 RepID=A0A8X6MRY7_NEPPI|nr:e1A binding protein p300 a [Nephila pilipes]